MGVLTRIGERIFKEKKLQIPDTGSKETGLMSYGIVGIDDRNISDLATVTGISSKGI